MPRRGDTPNFGDLQVDYVHGAVTVGPQQHLEPVDVLVQYERQVDVLPHRQAFFVGAARLLDVDVKVGHGVRHANCIRRQPTGISVGNQRLAVPKYVRCRPDPVDVTGRIPANFKLKLSISLLSVARNILSHLGGGALADGAVKFYRFPEASTQQMANRSVQHLPRQIPASHIQRGFHIRVTQQCLVHQVIDFLQLGRVLSENMRRQLTDACPGPCAECRQIEWAKRTHLAETGESVTGQEFDNRTVEHLDVFAFRPGVSSFLERKLHFVDVDTGDLH